MRFQSIFIGLSKLFIQLLVFCQLLSCFLLLRQTFGQTLQQPPFPEPGDQHLDAKMENNDGHSDLETIVATLWQSDTNLVLKKKNLIHYILPQEPKKNIFQKCPQKPYRLSTFSPSIFFGGGLSLPLVLPPYYDATDAPWIQREAAWIGTMEPGISKQVQGSSLGFYGKKKRT